MGHVAPSLTRRINQNRPDASRSVRTHTHTLRGGITSGIFSDSVFPASDSCEHRCRRRCCVVRLKSWCSTTVKQWHIKQKNCNETKKQQPQIAVYIIFCFIRDQQTVIPGQISSVRRDIYILKSVFVYGELIIIIVVLILSVSLFI